MPRNRAPDLLRQPQLESVSRRRRCSEMADDGVERALAFFTSAYSSYSGCRQYREDIFDGPADGRAACTRGSEDAGFFNHPGWIETNADHVRDALAQMPAGREPHTSRSRRTRSRSRWRGPAATRISSRVGPARRGGGRRRRHGARLSEPQRAAAGAVARARTFSTTFARSPRAGSRDVVVAPIGFVSDHLEVIYDLDIEAREPGRRAGSELRPRVERVDPSRRSWR